MLRMIALVISLIVTICMTSVNSIEEWEPFAATCEVPALGVREDCLVAQFSAEKNYSLSLAVSREALTLCGLLCEPERHLSAQALKSAIAVIHRGVCSFERKLSVATALGYQAVILINSADSLVVVGGELQSGGIPLFVVRNSTLFRITEAFTVSAEDKYPVKLTYNRAKRKVTTENGSSMQWIVIAGLFVLSTVILFVASSPINNPQLDDVLTWRDYLLCLLIIILSFMLRLGTQRISNPASLSHDRFNHNETDERIYHTLVDCVLKSWSSYSLRGHKIITEYRLAKSNYNDALFIHPPVFVYLSALLNYFGVDLAIVPLVFHVLTALCLVGVVAIIDLPFELRRGDVLLYTVQIFCLCPIACFCSQKFWIDNCAMMSVAVSSFVHVLVVNRSKGFTDSAVWHTFSGIVFGLLALNTKLSNLALFPFLIMWSFVRSIQQKHIVWWHFVVVAVLFSFGTFIGHFPWVYAYFITTGRYLPNAWPSAEMIKSSTFLQNAIAKPFYYYFMILLSISPVLMFGLISSLFGFTRFAMLYTNICPSEIKLKHTSISYLTLLFWPMGFLGGLTMVGIFGGGYQTRFLLPALPALALLSAIELLRSRWAAAISPFLISIGAIHLVFYGILFYPLFCDFDFNLFEIILCTLSYPQYFPANEESFSNILKYMRHFGLNRTVA